MSPLPQTPNVLPTADIRLSSVLDEDLAPYDINARRAEDRRLYENSQLAGSSLEEAYDDNPDKFFNSKQPNLAILHENPRHRLVVMLKAQGKTNTKIAELTGYTGAHVSQILRQPWARTLLVRELKEAGQDAVRGILAGAVEDSIYTLIELRDKAKQDADTYAVARGCANDILDRFLGKPTQHVEQNVKATVTSESVEELNAELAELEREEKRLLGNN